MSIPEGSRLIAVRRQSDGAGYLMNDSRNAGEGVEENDILCCPHCQCTINLQAWRKYRADGGTMQGGYCRSCKAPVCPLCTDRMLKYGCEPFIREVERAVETTYRRGQLVKTLGI